MSENKGLTIQLPVGEVQPTEEEIKKSTGWAKFGLAAAKNEVSINLEADKAIAKYALPTDIALLQVYDNEFAELKKIAATLEELRKKDTDITDGWKKRRMEAEKRVLAHIEAWGEALLPLKQESQEARNREQLLQDAKVEFRKIAAQEAAALTAQCNLVVAETVHNLYIRALGSDAITEITPAIMKSMKAQLSEKSFALPPLTADADWKVQILNEMITGVHNPAEHLEAFHLLLDARFEHFATDKKDAAGNIARAEEIISAARVAIFGKKEAQEVAAEMHADAVAPVELAHKPLKDAYELDMPETIESAEKIIEAFIISNLWDKLRVKNVFNISIGQMAAALAKLKSEDNALEIEGLTFKPIQKI